MGLRISILHGQEPHLGHPRHSRVESLKRGHLWAYLWDLNAVNVNFKGGEIMPNNYLWFFWYFKWRLGQLEHEVTHGV